MAFLSNERMRWPFTILVLDLALVVVPTTRAEDVALPTPPQQAKAWTPPETTLPKFLTRASATLFEQGLADPRGCEYRTIEVTVGNVWGGKTEVTTHGWVLPSEPGAETRYAIAWSGLVYPLIQVGEPADLDADVRELLDSLKKQRAGSGGQMGRFTGFQSFGGNNEASSIDLKTLHPIKICMLLRLGQADLAEAIWAAVFDEPEAKKPPGDRPKLDLRSYGVSYLTLARDLAWSRFDRALCAHMRGDDRLALADLRALDPFALAVERKAEAMGFARPERSSPSNEEAPYIEFLTPLPEFRDDQERRARERANPPPVVLGKAPKDRVAALIRDLDQVAVRQFGQPGGVFLGQSPIVQELIGLGDVAVEPLIQAFRSDDRLTRSVGFGRDFMRYRHILPAYEAAHMALKGILKTSNFAPGMPGQKPLTRQDAADQMLDYWHRNRSIPIVERWYRTLADDDAKPSAWLEAAANIVQPENVRTIPSGGAFTMTTTTPLKPGEKPRLRGEPLRQDHAPTVADLMARRIESMLKTPEGQRFELREPCQMATMLAAWDPAAGLPTLREMTELCRKRYARSSKKDDWTIQNLATSITRFTMAREKGGDPDALREYADWIRTVSPMSFRTHVLKVLEPLYRYPDNPDLAASAAWLFGDPRSPWVPLLGLKGRRAIPGVGQLIVSPMIDVPAFRTMLLKALDDHSTIGKVKIGKQGYVTVSIDNGPSMSRGTPMKDDRDVPPPGTSIPVNTCDFVAWQLSTLKGAPSFHPGWSEPKRETARAAIAEFLKRKGAR